MNAPVRLLVVDDEEVICRSCAKIFEPRGFEVETCTSPAEGLRRARDKEFNVILLDIMMPEVGGMEFLEQLRATNPDVPVIIITGYSSVDTAAEAMRLRAADYVPKPFTPEEITDAVERVAGMARRAVPAAAHKPKPAVWSGSGDRFFLRDSWAEPSADQASARVGLLLTSDEGPYIETLRCAAVGDEVCRGLPLAEVVLADGRRRIIASPVDGTIVECNAEVTANPASAWSDPCGAGWLARVALASGVFERGNLERRRVVVCTTEAATSAGERDALGRLGCEIVTATDAPAVIAALRACPGALWLDADSLGTAGPDILRQARAALPELRAVVVGTELDRAAHDAFRAERALYVAVRPLGQAELGDLVVSMFRPTRAQAATRTTRSVLPSGISALRVERRDGTAVSLLGHGGLLHVSRGVGQRIVQRVLGESLPLRVTLGAGPLGPKDLVRAAELCDRVVVLEARDVGRLPGCVVRERPGRLAVRAGELASQVTTLLVQPGPNAAEPLDLDDDTAEALASLVVAELMR